MRSTFDRIRHAICFELIGLLLVTVLGSWIFGFEAHAMGVVAVIGATLATGWNYLYNLMFDKAMLRARGSTAKTPAIRVFHAVLFEAGLLAAMLPVIAWHLGVTLMQALVMDLGFAGFYLVYAFAFNWAYDIIFPVPPAPRAA